MEKVTMGSNQKVKPTQKWYRVVAEVATLSKVWFKDLEELLQKNK
jgi:hypothetical protein